MIWAALLYLVWVALTYLLEGRLHTLLRPEATQARLVYTLLANLLLGVLGACWVLRSLNKRGIVTPPAAGFRGSTHGLVSLLVGGALGFLLYALQGPPTFHPVVLVNAFAQVLVVSMAEVMVCWAVIGSLGVALLRGVGNAPARIVAAAVASVLFGLYHFAHSPPFNTWPMVLLLTGVGFVTSLFFFLSRNVYATIVFHNFLGVLGVTQALALSNELAAFRQVKVPLLATAAAAMALLIVVHALWLRRPAPE